MTNAAPNSLTRRLPDTLQEAGESIVQPIGPTEDLISLTQAAKLLPKIDGRKIAVSTLFRWTTKGLRGQRLQHVKLGRKIVTTHEALRRFFEALADRDDRRLPETGAQPRVLKRRPITSRQRQRSLAEADSIIKRAKI